MPQPTVTANAAVRVLPLPAYAFLACEGARAGEFLQGQLTCDLRVARADAALPGACCTLQGRVVASFLLWQQAPERVLLRLRADIAQASAAHLAKYAVFTRTRVAEAVPRLAVIGVLGTPQALQLRSPGRQHGILELEQAWLLQRDADGVVHELWVQESAAAAWLERLSTNGATASADDWQAELVRLEEVEIQAATAGQFLPQMLGYERSGALSFRKGCYTGQEVVARTHYKGAVKRRLYRLRGEGEVPPPGTALRAGERSAGTVVESARGGAGEVLALAVLGEEAAQDGMDLLPENGHAQLRVADQGQGPL